jgi:hypothetical protein
MEWLAWQTNMNAKNDEIYLAAIDGSNPRNLTDAPGRWPSVVFESDRTGSWEKFESTRPRM